MECGKCGESFSSEREKLRHLLQEHKEELSSHRRDELKRELNRIGSERSDGLDFPARSATLVMLFLAVLGGGYAAFTTGAVSFSAGSDEGGGPVSVGPVGSTHDHASFSVVVEGERVDFSLSRYQLQSQEVHFENGDGSTIHKHATGVTVGYALQTLGMGVNETCLETVSDTYCEPDGDLTVTVNGGEVEEPAETVIRDGQNIRIEYSG